MFPPSLSPSAAGFRGSVKQEVGVIKEGEELGWQSESHGREGRRGLSSEPLPCAGPTPLLRGIQ